MMKTAMKQFVAMEGQWWSVMKTFVVWTIIVSDQLIYFNEIETK